MQPHLDLSKRAWTAEREGLTAIGTWVRLDDPERGKPRWQQCMVLLRTGDISHERAIPCVVTSDHAWIWSEEIGDARQVAHIVVSFLKALRFDENDPHDHFKIIAMVTDHLGDLLHIPPRPRFEDDFGEADEPVAQVTIVDHQTGATTEAEV